MKQYTEAYRIPQMIVHSLISCYVSFSPFPIAFFLCVHADIHIQTYRYSCFPYFNVVSVRHAN
ncbi:unnamed protein product [Phytomonas sp. Hart1]|nr:unnamed protein product [Phytomonas sp. Hart1]|eukprot:CCW67697.1 unnamed protein product [Phytomonas sp. isolate Hart1]